MRRSVDLADARGPEHGDRLAGVDRKVHGSEHRRAAEAFPDDLNHDHALRQRVARVSQGRSSKVSIASITTTKLSA